MKRAASLLALLMTLLLAAGCAAASEEIKTIVTSFYPMYIFTQNVAQGIEDVEVVNMADQNVGCLHDYQLQTRDMVTLEGASALVVNGGGMEQFMDKIASLYANVPVITAGEGIEMMHSVADEGHDHDGHDHDHEGVVYNAHVWLNPDLAARQVRQIADGLSQADPANAAAYQENAQAYIARIMEVKQEIAAQLAPHAGKQIVIFHEAFAYFAEAFGLEVAGVIAYEADEEPGTREIARTCDLVKELGVNVLLTEPQYPTKTADIIARETSAKVYAINPVVSGDGAMDSYETIMRGNAQVLAEAFAQ